MFLVFPVIVPIFLGLMCRSIEVSQTLVILAVIAEKQNLGH